MAKKPTKTKYKFIHFVEIKRNPKTEVYSCLNNSSGDELGIVKWYPAWRQYCFFSAFDIVFNAGCLDDITHFMDQMK